MRPTKSVKSAKGALHVHLKPKIVKVLEKKTKAEKREKERAELEKVKAAKRAAAVAAQAQRSMEQGKNKLWDTSDLRLFHLLADALELYLPAAGDSQDDWKLVAKYMNERETRGKFKGQFGPENCYARFNAWKSKKNSDGTVSCTGRNEDEGPPEDREEVKLVLRFWDIEEKILTKHGAHGPHEADAKGAEKKAAGQSDKKLSKAELERQQKEQRVPLGGAATHRGTIDGKSSVSTGESKKQASAQHAEGFAKFTSAYSKEVEARGAESRARLELLVYWHCIARQRWKAVSRLSGDGGTPRASSRAQHTHTRSRARTLFFLFSGSQVSCARRRTRLLSAASRSGRTRTAMARQACPRASRPCARPCASRGCWR